MGSQSWHRRHQICQSLNLGLLSCIDSKKSRAATPSPPPSPKPTRYTGTSLLLNVHATSRTEFVVPHIRPDRETLFSLDSTESYTVWFVEDIRKRTQATTWSKYNARPP
jgi:hypothetical protein